MRQRLNDSHCISVTVGSSTPDEAEFTGRMVGCFNPVCECFRLTYYMVKSIRCRESQWPQEMFISFDLKSRQIVVHLPEQYGSTAKERLIRSQITRTLQHKILPSFWRELEDRYYAMKEYASDLFPVDRIAVSLPQDILEDPSLVIGYVELFPYAMQIVVDIEGADYLCMDMYCMGSGSCDSSVRFLVCRIRDLDTADSHTPVALYLFDYRKRILLEEALVHEGFPTGRALRQALFSAEPNLIRLVRIRHRRLNTLYRRNKNRCGRCDALSLEKILKKAAEDTCRPRVLP